MKKFAIIDLGSNTFHLLIVERKATNEFTTHCRQRVFVGLSDGGIKTIKDEKITFGLEVLREFKSKLNQFNNPELRVIGTAILRSATNRQIFISQAETILQCVIEIIDGQTEADYIYKGIMLMPELKMGIFLLMDIGGGSTEFILVVDGSKIWSESYTLGVGVLHNLFHTHEPIGETAIHAMYEYILTTISSMVKVIQNYKIDAIIGASGSFEVLQSMTGKMIYEDEICKISIQEFLLIFKTIVESDFEERTNLKGLPSERVKLIVVGMVLKKIIIDVGKPKSIIVSPYALKEGVLSEMIKSTI